MSRKPSGRKRVAPVVFRPAVCALAFALFLSVRPSALCEEKPKPAAADAGSEVQAEWILRQLQKDMMYGSDDFFGEDTDLSYADVVVPEGGKGLSQELAPVEVADRHSEAKPPEPEPPPDEEPPPV